jgi:hypothetical protein
MNKGSAVARRTIYTKTPNLSTRDHEDRRVNLAANRFRQSGELNRCACIFHPGLQPLTPTSDSLPVMTCRRGSRTGAWSSESWYMVHGMWFLVQMK